MDIAEALGIDLTNVPTKQYETVGGSTLVAKIHSVKLQVACFNDEWITIKAGFIVDDEIPLTALCGIQHF